MVDLQVTRKKVTLWKHVPFIFIDFSEKRTEAVCEHYGICGGCKWQILPYTEQIRYKQKQVVDNLTRIGKIALPEITPMRAKKPSSIAINLNSLSRINAGVLTKKLLTEKYSTPWMPLDFTFPDNSIRCLTSANAGYRPTIQWNKKWSTPLCAREKN